MPTFGHAMRSEWLLDPDVTYLNHGTVGATPRRVLSHQRAITDEIERQPARFMLRELADEHGTMTTPPRLRVAADAVAEFVGVAGEDLMFVDNITTGANAILRSFPFDQGDEIAVTNLGYGGVVNAARYMTRRIEGTLRTIELPQPGASRDSYVEAIATGLGEHTRVLIIDHLTPGSAMILPLAEITAVCHERGVLVLADGAHVPGNIAVDIDSFGVDWYVANLHKWAHAPRGCGILWAAPERQSMLHFPVVSWGRDRGFRDEFEHTPTTDPTSYLAAPEGIAMLREWGFDVCAAYMHGLAWEAAAMLTDRWGTTFEIPRHMVGTMVTVPLPGEAGATEADAEQVRLELLLEDRIEVPLFAWSGRLWARVSAQIYNDRADIDRLAGAVMRRIAAAPERSITTA